MNQQLRNRKSPRASWWDYSSPSAYFVTICTKDRVHLFGEIVDSKMHYSHSGIIANIIWYEIKNHFPTVELDEFVVMPNHIHGIIVLKPPIESYSGAIAGGAGRGDSGSDNAIGTGGSDSNHAVVGTGHALSLPNDALSLPNDALSLPNDALSLPNDALSLPNNALSLPNDALSQQNKKPPNLSAVVGSYKSAVTKHCNRLGLPSGWQSRFHDVIIKSENDYERIKITLSRIPKTGKMTIFTNKIENLEVSF